MIATIDAGNTRIKWGLHDGRGWTATGAIPTAHRDALKDILAAWPDGIVVALCNVAGNAVRADLDCWLRERGLTPRWLLPGAIAAGLKNDYQAPEQLGADRWAAAIGAWGLIGGACLVVCAGTATTVDLIDAEGVFRGGAILPGYDLMRRALANNTAQLPLAEGDFCGIGRNTQDAIVSGCLNAQAGAIERLARRLPSGAPVLVSGGAAGRIAPCLELPVRRIDNLVLEGLLHHARHPEG